VDRPTSGMIGKLIIVSGLDEPRIPRLYVKTSVSDVFIAVGVSKVIESDKRSPKLKSCDHSLITTPSPTDNALQFGQRFETDAEYPIDCD